MTHGSRRDSHIGRDAELESYLGEEGGNTPPPLKTVQRKGHVYATSGNKRLLSVEGKKKRVPSVSVRKEGRGRGIFNLIGTEAIGWLKSLDDVAVHRRTFSIRQVKGGKRYLSKSKEKKKLGPRYPPEKGGLGKPFQKEV